MDDAPGLAEAGGETRRFLTFHLDRRLYALPVEEVSEIIRTPPVARLPHAPKSLMGLANLRGSILPVASLRGLMGEEGSAGEAPARAIVLSGGAAVALAVDAIDALVSVDTSGLQTDRAVLAAEPGEALRGAFQMSAGDDLAKILDIQSLLSAAFAPRARAPRPSRGELSTTPSGETAGSMEDWRKLVSFEVAGQEYALDLAAVQEITPAPTNLARIARSEALVVGIKGYRDTLLTVLSMRGLLGFAAASEPDGREKVVVTTVRGLLVGLLVDRMRAIVTADPRRLEPPPPVLAARAGGESQIAAIYRESEGERLISVLAVEQLFREEVMQRLGDTRPTAPAPAETIGWSEGEEVKFLVFSLGDDEFALPIEAVDEVASVPEQITRVPKTPKFLEGVINLRGEVLPVVDQRRRFDMPAREGLEGRRLVVVRSERHRAGLIVDSVSEVLGSSRDEIEPAPDLTGEKTRLVNGVINLDRAGRIILLLDPAELLNRTERGLLDAFEADARAVG
jgi:purine-binding chemotaxis protein CheW